MLKSNVLPKLFLFGGTVPSNNFLIDGTVQEYNFFGGTVPANNFLFAGTVPANNILFAGTVPANSFPQYGVNIDQILCTVHCANVQQILSKFY